MLTSGSLSRAREAESEVCGRQELEIAMTEKQAAFVKAFLGAAEYRASPAARMAGYRWPDKVGWQLLRHPKIAPAIEAEAAADHPSWSAWDAEVKAARAERRMAEAKDRARKEARRAYARSRA